MIEKVKGILINGRCFAKETPLSFFPGWLQNILNLLPYSGIQNAPLEIYTGSLEGPAAWNTVWTQLFWLGALTVIGRLMFRKGIRQVVVQGG